MRQLTLDLLVSRLYCQFPRYIAWKPNTGSVATDACLHPWDREYSFAFPPFSLISWVLRKILWEKIDHLIIVTPTWQTQPWYAQLLEMSVQPPFLLPQIRNLLANPQGKNHPLEETGSPRLAVWKVSGKVCKFKKFQAMLPNLSHIQGEKAQQRITNRLGVSGVAGVMKDKLILFKHLWITLLISCLKIWWRFLKILKFWLQYRTLNCLRSAISAYHVHIDGKSVGKHPKVCALLTGIFNQRPPQPRYFYMGCGDSFTEY